MTETSAKSGEAVKKGDFVLLDYEIWAEGAGKREIVDTTSKEVADQAKWEAKPSTEFHPHPHLIGRDYFPGGIEKALEGLKVGETLDKEFPASEAFGEKDPNLIELHSIREIARLPEMRRDDARLDVGTILTIDNRRGRVVSLTAGRVRVDFNNPFAGRKVQAKVKILSKITGHDEVAKALIEMDYGQSAQFSVDVKDHVVTVKLPDRTKFDVNWFASKGKLVEDIREHLKPTSIHFVEEYKTPPPRSAEKESKSESPAPEAHAARAEAPPA